MVKRSHIKLVNIIDDPSEGMLTRSMASKLNAALASECLFTDFLSEIEPKKMSGALKHPRWIDVMQEEMNQFYRNKFWTLVPLPHVKITLSSKWVFSNKKDEHEIITKNKARLVAQGYSQEEGTNYDETPVNETLYRGVISSLMYLKGTPSLGLYYSKCLGFGHKGYSDQTMLVATWIEKEHQVPVKSLERSWDHILKGDIELHSIPTEYQLADIFSKPLDEPTFTRLKAKLGMLNID
ncbi:retrovirus-related pol polyprotein from transposon TNT 1-94 [Tanacetum coccineum]